MAKILMIEDEPGLQLTVGDLLTDQGYEVTIVGEGPRGEAEAQKTKFDIILLDIMLPGKDGFQVCRSLRESGNKTPILMLTARGSSIDTVMGLKLGADDYLTKPFDSQVLLARIEAILRRSPLGLDSDKDKPVNQFSHFIIDRTRGTLTRHENGEVNEINLNTQEFRLLEYFTDHPSKVLSRNELLDGVWGYETETSTRTVDVHIAWLRQKLGEKELPRHIITLRGRGYKFIP